MNEIKYPAILTREGKTVLVRIPDFDEMTEGRTITNAINMAKELVTLCVADIRDMGGKLPKASNPSDFVLEPNQKLVWVVVSESDMEMVETCITEEVVSIPTWLSLLSKERNIDLSEVLVKGLRVELGLDD